MQIVHCCTAFGLFAATIALTPTICVWRGGGESSYGTLYLFMAGYRQGLPEQGIKLLGLLLTGSTGQRMASRNGLA